MIPARYSVSRCRGHWHVTGGDGEFDIRDHGWPSDKFGTYREAAQAAYELEYENLFKALRETKGAT